MNYLSEVIETIDGNMHDPDTIAPEEIARAKIKYALDHKEVMVLCRHYGCLTEDVTAAELLSRFRRM